MNNFSAVIYKEGMLYAVEIPKVISANLDIKGHLPVRGLADNIPFKGVCVPRRGNRFIIFLNTDTRRKINKTEGDFVEMQIEYDPDSRDLPVPEDVEIILSENQEILEEFMNLTPLLKREITQFITEAKKEETRLKRINILRERMRERIAKRKK
jgi:hypothetical protein